MKNTKVMSFNAEMDLIKEIDRLIDGVCISRSRWINQAIRAALKASVKTNADSNFEKERLEFIEFIEKC